MEGNYESHGHVYPRADGGKARCGGPGICVQCSREKAELLSNLKFNDNGADRIGEAVLTHVKNTGKLPTDWDQLIPPEEISVQKVWELYRRTLTIDECSPIQQIEMRKCFVLGFAECFKIVIDYCSNVPEEKAEQMLDRLSKELEKETDKIRAHYPYRPMQS